MSPHWSFQHFQICRPSQTTLSYQRLSIFHSVPLFPRSHPFVDSRYQFALEHHHHLHRHHNCFTHRSLKKKLNFHKPHYSKVPVLAILLALAVPIDGKSYLFANHSSTNARKNQLPTNNYQELFFCQENTLDEDLSFQEIHPKNLLCRFENQWGNSVPCNR